jgi:UDP-2-acetamido-2-deoxy-ribo-hexuluronate aminotransferase
VDLLLDVNIVIDLCVPRPQGLTASANAVARCMESGNQVWLYAGAAQSYEDRLRDALDDASKADTEALTRETSTLLARQRLAAFAQDKQWLAALAGDCNTYDTANPERERMLRALDRFPPGAIRLLTTDASFALAQLDKAITPEQYLARPQPARRIDFIDLPAQQASIRPQLEQQVHRVLHHGRYILGPEMEELERRLAQFTGAAHCVTAASGTEALLISLMALGIGPGDEVITTPFTFVATAEVIVLVGARPVFVDVEPDTCNIDSSKIAAAITPRTRAIMPVSLYGQPADMDEINAIAAAHELPVIEDAAQSFGATYKGRRSGNLSTIGCTSFFPSKPLGCYGDGGAIFTNDDALAQAMREIRVHGQSQRYVHTRIGVGGRMDTLQCAVLLAKLDRFDWEIGQRIAVGDRYTALFTDTPAITTPVTRPDRTCVYAQYTLQVPGRDALVEALGARGIPTAVHYPIALTAQPAYRHLCCPDCTPVAAGLAQLVISLPMHADLAPGVQDQIASALIEALESGST